MLASISALLLGSLVPALAGATVTLEDVDGNGLQDVRVTGGGASERVFVTENGTAGLFISIDANGDGDFTDPEDTLSFPAPGTTDAIFVSMGGGNDVCAVNLGQDATVVRHLFVDLGAGNDTFELGVGLGFVFQTGSSYHVDLLGGAGNDTATFAQTNVFNSRISLRADLGAGNDVVSLFWDAPQTNSVVDAEILLGAGNDTASGDLTLSLTDASAWSLAIFGGAGKDAVTIEVPGISVHSDGAFGLLVDGEAGDDTILLEDFLSGFGIFNLENGDTGGRASIALRGGQGKDSITVSPGAGSPQLVVDGLLELEVSGGTHDDTIAVDFGATGGLATEQLGAERREFSFHLDAGAGKDVVVCTLRGLATYSGDLDVYVGCGAGDDTLSLSVDALGAATFGPGSRVVVDGGDGKKDRLLSATGNAPIVTRRFEP